MCPFRITWCIAPGSDPRGSLERGTGKACDHRCVAMIATLRKRYYRYGTVSYRNLFPRCACDPGHIRFPGSAGLREEVGLTEHAGGRVDDQGQGERGVLAH